MRKWLLMMMGSSFLTIVECGEDFQSKLSSSPTSVDLDSYLEPSNQQQQKLSLLTPIMLIRTQSDNFSRNRSLSIEEGGWGLAELNTPKGQNLKNLNKLKRQKSFEVLDTLKKLCLERTTSSQLELENINPEKKQGVRSFC